jgi:hypothetical protein
MSGQLFSALPCYVEFFARQLNWYCASDAVVTWRAPWEVLSETRESQPPISATSVVAHLGVPVSICGLKM